MALRRVLPSRATPDTKPESAAVPENQPKKADDRPRNPPRQSAPQSEPAPNPFAGMALPDPVPEQVPEPAIAPALVDTASFAAAATSAFSTLPAGAVRVLEESFTAPAMAPEPVAAVPAPQPEARPAPQPEPQPEPTPAPAAVPEFTAPAWQAPAEPEPVLSAPAWEAPAIPEPQSAPVAEPVREEPMAPGPSTAPDLPPVPEFSAPAWQSAEPAPAPTIAEPAPQPEPEPQPVPEPTPVPMPESQPQPQPEVQPEASAQPAEAAGTTFDFQPSRPDSSPHKRRVREKRPRDFTAMGAPENQTPERIKPDLNFAPSVPVDTKPLDQVDESLIATGIMAAPPPDSLTASLPTALAEMAFQPPVQPVAATPAPQPEPLPEAKKEARPEPETRPEPAPQPEPARPVQEEPKLAPPELPQPAVILPDARPEPVAAPSFTLANTTATTTVNMAPATPLPPAQTDLPWTQSQTAAEWEIDTPAAGWAPETGQQHSAAHMPPPTDLYKPHSANHMAPLPPVAPAAAGIPPRTGNTFTPELPGQRRKSGGTPWALIGIGVVAVALAGAWYLRGGTSRPAQQQLANLTTPTGTGSSFTPAGMDSGLLPPPRTGEATTFDPLAATPSTSSSAVVAFADVPPEEAGQPIVADTKSDKTMPEDMSFIAQMQKAVAEARAKKEQGKAAVPDATPAAEESAVAAEKIKAEIDAYRSALAQSANPAALKPSQFMRDPDGYMDGKNQINAQPGTATGATGEMASGALLPPPTGTEGGALPPPELYTNNPKNLPVVAEPQAQAPARVRTLADFPDIEPYAPEREKVEIPKNLKPKLAATDFPSLEVLSFVPGRGIVAYADGREGVLLIGESINGWELVAVAPDNAEFKAGQKSHQVTAEN